MHILNGYTMSLLLIGIVAALGGIVYTLYLLKHECLNKAKEALVDNVLDHKIIRQTIKVTDDKMVELEIRVKVLEDNELQR